MVREEILMKTPTRNRHSFSEVAHVGITSSNLRKKSSGSGGGGGSVPALTHPKIKRVQEWLQDQSIVPNSNGPPPLLLSAATTDCEASGEYTGKLKL